MRFINKWSYACAKGLAQALNENHQRRFEYYYGFQILIGEFVKTAILIGTSLILGVFLPMLIVSVAFIALRMIAGGYHMDTQGKCLLVSLIMFIAAALLAKYTYAYWSTLQLAVLIAVTFLSGLYVVIKYAPKDNPNKPITDPGEILKFKKLSVAYLLLWLAAAVILTLFKLNIFVVSSGFGVLLELFIVTPVGHRFFDRVKYGLRGRGAGNQ